MFMDRDTKTAGAPGIPERAHKLISESLSGAIA